MGVRDAAADDLAELEPAGAGPRAQGLAGRGALGGRVRHRGKIPDLAPSTYSPGGGGPPEVDVPGRSRQLRQVRGHTPPYHTLPTHHLQLVVFFYWSVFWLNMGQKNVKKGVKIEKNKLPKSVKLCSFATLFLKRG